jgi:hypothetical protein
LYKVLTYFKTHKEIFHHRLRHGRNVSYLWTSWVGWRGHLHLGAPHICHPPTWRKKHIHCYSHSPQTAQGHVQIFRVLMPFLTQKLLNNMDLLKYHGTQRYSLKQVWQNLRIGILVKWYKNVTDKPWNTIKLFKILFNEMHGL